MINEEVGLACAIGDHVTSEIDSFGKDNFTFNFYFCHVDPLHRKNLFLPEENMDCSNCGKGRVKSSLVCGGGFGGGGGSGSFGSRRRLRVLTAVTRCRW